MFIKKYIILYFRTRNLNLSSALNEKLLLSMKTANTKYIVLRLLITKAHFTMAVV